MVLNVSHSPQYYCFFLKTCFCLLSSGAETTQYQSWESRQCFNTFELEQGFSVSALLTFVLDNYLLWELSYACRLFSSILGLYPLDVSSIPQPLPNFCCCDTCEKCLQMLGNIFLRSEITPIEISSSRGLSPSRLASLCYSPGTLESAQVLETTFSLFTDKKMNA